MSKQQQGPSQLDMDIAQIENTRRILSNMKGILRTGTYSGADVHNVAESINFTNHLYEECNKQLQAMKKSKGEPKAVEMVSSEELPKPEGV